MGGPYPLSALYTSWALHAQLQLYFHLYRCAFTSNCEDSESLLTSEKYSWPLWYIQRLDKITYMDLIFLLAAEHSSDRSQSWQIEYYISS